jgi:hypothetical protein
MALARTDLTPGPIQIGAGVTVGICTVRAVSGVAQTIYLKSLMIHNLDASNTQNVKVHFVPNSSGNVGIATSVTQFARLGIGTDDTFFLEPAYPITLTKTGDSIQVQNEGNTTNSINVVATGDIEV